MNRQVTCQYFKDHLGAYLDSELDQETRSLMIRHADQCPECGERLETMTRLLTMCAELDEGLVVPLDVQSAWRRAVREEAAGHHRRGHGGFVRALTTVAAAAVLLVGGTFAYRIAGLPPIEAPIAQPQSKMAMSADASNDYGISYNAQEMDAYDDVVMESDGEIGENTGVAALTTPSVVDAPERKKVTIRSAQRTFESSTFDKTMQLINDLTDEYNGYFEQQSVAGQALEAGRKEGRYANMTVRVLDSGLDSFLASLNVAGTLTYSSDKEEDISTNYYDVASRLASYRKQLDRYNELVASAARLEDMLLLQDKIYQVQEEIESLERRILGWDSRAEMATVYITLTEVAERNQVQPIGTTLEERIRGAFYDSLDWLSAFMQDAAVVLAWAAPALVIAIPLIIVLCVIISAVKRRRRKRK